ncbi:hypothetical protein BGZ58_003046, partial [Dissophora ornata]
MSDSALNHLAEVYLKERDISEVSAIDFFDFHCFRAHDANIANTAWSRFVIPQVELQQAKRGAALRAESEATRPLRARYWKDVAEKENKENHQVAMKGHARKQIQVVANVVDHEVEELSQYAGVDVEIPLTASNLEPNKDKLYQLF